MTDLLSTFSEGSTSRAASSIIELENSKRTYSLISLSKIRGSLLSKLLSCIALVNNLFGSFYQGTKNTRETSFDKREPIEVQIVSPTKIVTQDSDISKLKTK